ncbi:MAG: hypothetical protein R2695_21830 [Acidimicrobiales bacterium]
MGASVCYRYRAQQPVGFVPWMANDLRLLTTELAVAVRALPGKPLGVDYFEPAPGRRAGRCSCSGSSSCSP